MNGLKADAKDRKTERMIWTAVATVVEREGRLRAKCLHPESLFIHGILMAYPKGQTAGTGSTTV